MALLQLAKSQTRKLSILRVRPELEQHNSDEEAPATKVTLKINRAAVPEEIESD